jgi:hypothetical protein
MKEAVEMKVARVAVLVTAVWYSTPWQTSLNKIGTIAATSLAMYRPIDGSLPH